MGGQSYKCDICHKSFSRKDNLKRHMGRHSDNSQHQCKECGKVFAKAHNLHNHMQNKHGSQTKKRPPTDDTAPPPKRMKDEVTEYYTLRKINESRSKKFNSKKITYKMKFNELHVTGLKEILLALKDIFGSLIKQLTKDANASDIIRMAIQNPELDYPIIIPFMKRDQLTVERLLSEIERVLQSYEEFVLDKEMELDIIYVEKPNGGTGKRCRFVDLPRILNEKRCIIQINNSDDLCAARAIITAKAKLDNHPMWNSIRQGRKVQEILAKQLHDQANVPLGKCEVDEIKQFQRVLPGYQIFVISKKHNNAVIYNGPESEKKIYLYQHDDHYDIITSLTAFLGRNYFCHQCKKGYDHRERHKCNNTCIQCRHIHDVSDEDWIECELCNRNFRGKECFTLHRKTTKFGNSTCSNFYKCLDCRYVVNKTKRKSKHRCGELFCITCNEYYMEGHQCYMQPYKTNEQKKEDNNATATCDQSDHNNVDDQGFQDDMDDSNGDTYIYFDFECRQESLQQCEAGFVLDNASGKCKHCKKAKCGSFLHEPNLCVAQKICTLCQDNSDCDKCGEKQHVFSGKNTTHDFCKWLFSGKNNGSIVLAHNFRSYDAYPILQYLYDNSILPKVIPNGTKIMSIDVACCKIKMIDSLNFLPTSLSKLPSMFGLTELKKGYFPHLFNKEENQGRILPNLPDIEYYNPGGMTPEDREQFLKWYDLHKHDEFDVSKELLEYCKSDVDILRRCCLEFRKLFMNVSSSFEGDPGLDPFQHCITIASACNLVFRRNYLREETIGLIPAQGYQPMETHSIKAMKWLKYHAHKHGVSIQHARNGGEKEVEGMKLDGYYITNEGSHVALEYNGCLFHGCPSCFHRETVNPLNGQTMKDLHDRTVEKEQRLKDLGLKVISMWECQFDKQIKENEDIKEFVDQLNIVTPLEPRDAFYGGRTESFKLFEEANEEKTIKYYDVTSLYPYTNKFKKYVCGHPKRITENIQDLSNYEGLVKCKILPPRGLLLPLLPLKLNNKLMFALCKVCAENRQQTSCNHDDADRALTGTWTTMEIAKARSLGYIVVDVYEVWHFEKTAQYDPHTKTGGLFTEYINNFLKLKQQASGWPKWVTSEEQRQEYINNYYQHEGIMLDYDEIKKNPGMRALAKLMLNSFWGKFGQRSNMLQSQYTDDPAKFFDILSSDKQEVADVSFVSEEMVEMKWRYKDDFVETSLRTNVVIAAYTTAHARLQLYSYLEMLQDRVLYADTDSIVFVSNEGEKEPTLGDFLGDLTNEEADGKIVQFVTGGPKNYAYKVQEGDHVKTVCKIRGITLNYKTSLQITYDTIKDMVLGSWNDAIVVSDNFKIIRDPKTSSLLTTSQSKQYKIVFDKRVAKSDLSTIPYGF